MLCRFRANKRSRSELKQGQTDRRAPRRPYILLQNWKTRMRTSGRLEPFGTIWNEFGTLAFSACAGVTIDQGAVLCLYEGVEMIPEAGLLTFSVDKAPYSILMMVSIVSAYRLKARRGLSDSFFLIRVFFMRGTDYYITRKHQ